MTWEEALLLIESRVNKDPSVYSRVRDELLGLPVKKHYRLKAEGMLFGASEEEPVDPSEPPPAPPEPDPTMEIHVYADLESSPKGLKVAFKKSTDPEWSALGFLAVAE